MTLQSWKYAQVERERRVLLAAEPPSGQERTIEISDRYLSDSTLRLRKVEEAGRQPVYKLGQKVRLEATAADGIAHTTMYLTAAEFETLSALPGHDLTKTRRLVEWHAESIAVDTFHGALEGLVLAECDQGIELTTAARELGWMIAADVTDDERFTGGQLARSSYSDVQPFP